MPVRRLNLILGSLIVVTALFALASGPVDLWLPAVLSDATTRLIVLELRLPRIVAAILVGAALATAGILLQALLRNPLADPALIGVSGGAALGATLALASGLGVSLWLPVPAAAFAGALLATLLVWRLGTVHGRLHLAAVLLAGVAINTLAGALVGLLLAFSDDPALRATTFWLFGSVADVSWPLLATLAVLLPLTIGWLERNAHSLDTYQLGDQEATHAGLAVGRLQTLGILLASLLTGLAVAAAGIIGFIGLMVPHFMRMLAGASYQGQVLASAAGGALLLLVADTAARTLAAPAEIPVGLVTALLGAPFFLLLLRRELAQRGALT